MRVPGRNLWRRGDVDPTIGVARGTLALMVRFVCSLALIVAAMPIKAGVAPCAAPTPAPVAAVKATCAMPCCVEKPLGKTMSCHEDAAKPAAHPGQRHELAATGDGCGCEMQAAPSVPLRSDKAISTAFDPHFLVAVLPATLPELSIPTAIAEPGIFGIDSGPPARVGRSSDLGRAPPVARA